MRLAAAALLAFLLGLSGCQPLDGPKGYERWNERENQAMDYDNRMGDRQQDYEKE